MLYASSTLACPWRAMAFVVFLSLFAGCTTLEAPGDEPSPSLREGQAAQGEGEPLRDAVTVLGPAPSRFIDQSVTALEEVTGPPALVRREGANEFRRYDKDACRIYAIVMPAGGKVAKLSTGPALAGAETRSFEQCTAQAE
ncbi:MAG: hypothetical protein AAF723_00290 [Pseudomonadota bacterium]